MAFSFALRRLTLLARATRVRAAYRGYSWKNKWEHPAWLISSDTVSVVCDLIASENLGFATKTKSEPKKKAFAVVKTATQ